MATIDNCPMLDKLGKSEEFFAVRAQDKTSAKTVLFWIAENLDNDKMSDEKLFEAFESAIGMRNFPGQRQAD